MTVRHVSGGRSFRDASKAKTGLQILHTGPINRNELHPAAYPLLTRRTDLPCGKFPSRASVSFCWSFWRTIQDKSANTYVIEIAM